MGYATTHCAFRTRSFSELHQREFAALKQPADELAVNDTVDAVGFDFVRRPELEYEGGINRRKGEPVEERLYQDQDLQERSGCARANA